MTSDPKWANNLITFQEIHLHPRIKFEGAFQFWQGLQVIEKYDFFFNKENV